MISITRIVNNTFQQAVLLVWLIASEINKCYRGNSEGMEISERNKADSTLISSLTKLNFCFARDEKMLAFCQFVKNPNSHFGIHVTIIMMRIKRHRLPTIQAQKICLFTRHKLSQPYQLDIIFTSWLHFLRLKGFFGFIFGSKMQMFWALVIFLLI